MKITLNIGLNVSKHYTPEGVAEMELNYDYVKDCLARTLGKPMQIWLARSDTEKTIVVQYADADVVLQKLYWIAYELNQDCIAYVVKDDADTVLGGALVGEYAHEWNYGVFNAEYFIPATTKLEYIIGSPL